MPGPPLRVAVVAYRGVLADESSAFREVLGRIPRARVVTVGPSLGVLAGPGGAQQVIATFDDVTAADVVVVPGGLGSHHHVEIGRWVRRIGPRWVVASSTGSALLAAGGLLRGRRATTHWLAGPLLERFEVEVVAERVVVDAPFVTCSGLASAFDAAFHVVADVGGPTLVGAIREDLAVERRAESRIAAPVACAARSRYRPRARRGGPTVEVELEEHDGPR